MPSFNPRFSPSSNAPAAHPSLVELREYLGWRALETAVPDVDPATASSEFPPRAVAEHLEQCGVCRDSLAFLDTLSTNVAGLTAPLPTDRLKERILASHEAGAFSRTQEARSPARFTLQPSAAHSAGAAPAVRPTTARRRWTTVVALAAALAVVVVGSSLLTDTPEMIAGSTAGVLSLSTSTPRVGEAVTLRYEPTPMLARFRSLRVRGRVRSVNSEAYASGAPVITLATLERQGDGSYRGSVLLPDSIVFAALAVEDSLATEIDDRDGRTWELLRADASGRVEYEALDQRADDQMGRSWEEVFATARRMVAEYPDDLRAWSYLATTNSWMGLPSDSIRALHRSKVAEFDRRLRGQASVSGDEMGEMYWYARWVDSTSGAYWRGRMLREAPRNSFAIQERTMGVLDALFKTKDTTSALRDFELLWTESPTARRGQVASYATRTAVATRDTAAVRRWTDRLIAVNAMGAPAVPNPALVRSVANDFVQIPALRAEGLQRLRDEVARLASPSSVVRALNETREAYDVRVARSVAATRASLGRALASTGSLQDGLAMMQLAAADGWDLSLFHSIYVHARQARDSSLAVDMATRIAADPTTPPATIENYKAYAVAHGDGARWDAMVTQRQREFVRSTLATSRTKTIARDVMLTTLDGKAYELRAATKGQITVVAFLSRFCGPAIEIIPALHRVAARLAETGVRTVIVYEEAAASPALSAFLKQHDVTLPVTLDATQQASQVFNQWGTPALFVLDSKGRIVFAPTSDMDQLLIRAEAVRMSEAQQ